MTNRTIRPTIDGMEDMPKLREIDVLLKEASALAQLCRDGMADDDLTRAYETALSIMLELRVPRMPETEEEWAETLRDAMHGPTVSSEEAFASVRRHASRFDARLKEFRHAVENQDWSTADSLLVGGSDRGLVSWNGSRVTLTNEAGHTALNVHDTDAETTADTIEAPRSTSSGLAILLEAHIRNIRLWKR